MVQNVIPGGPAAAAQLQRGDRLHAVGDHEIDDLAQFWRLVWASGPAGATVALTLGRGRSTLEVTVQSAERAALLRSPKLH